MNTLARPFVRMDADDPTTLLGDAALEQAFSDAVAAAEAADDYLHAVAAEARRRGWPWARIGTTLGCTRQAAWQRFTRRSAE